MRKIFSVDVWICATAYIRAETKAEAARLALAMPDKGQTAGNLEFPTGTFGEIIISDAPLGSPELPEISLSPSMTIYGPLQLEAPLVPSVAQLRRHIGVAYDPAE